jgi:hypothetical protein
MATGAAGESCIPKHDHCHRIVSCNLLANLIVGLHLVDVGLPVEPSPLERAVELKEGIFVGEDVMEVGLEGGDRRAAWAWSS